MSDGVVEDGPCGPIPTWAVDEVLPSRPSRKALKRRIRELEKQLAEATAPPSTLLLVQRAPDGAGMHKQQHQLRRGEVLVVTLNRLYLANGDPTRPVWDAVPVEVSLL